MGQLHRITKMGHNCIFRIIYLYLRRCPRRKLITQALPVFIVIHWALSVLVTCGVYFSLTVNTVRPPDLSAYNNTANNRACANATRAVFIVSSHVGNAKRRETMRKAYPNEELAVLGMKRMFVLGILENDFKTMPEYKSVTQYEVELEREANGDLLQYNVVEAYGNETCKSLLGIQWAVNRCRETDFIIKIYDNTTLDLYRLLDLLHSFDESGNNVIGYLNPPLINGNDESFSVVDYIIWIFQHTPYYAVYRLFHYFYEYGYRLYHLCELYPDYVSGSLYILSLKTAQILLETSKIIALTVDEPENLYVTGRLTNAANVTLIDISGSFSKDLDVGLKCCTSEKVRFNCVYIVGDSGGDGARVQRIKQHAYRCFKGGGCKELYQDHTANVTCV